MRANVIALLGALSLLSACGKDAPTESAPLPLPTGPASVKPEPTASAAPLPAPKAEEPQKKIPPLRPLPESIEALVAELHKKCGPKEEPKDNVSQKEALNQEAECMRREMIADLDAVLLPLEASDPTRFAQLMKEQAVWNKYVKSRCWLHEELAWLDLKTGQRSDGTMRGYAYLGCLIQATAERTYYARALGNKNAKAVNARVLARQKPGANDALHELSLAAMKFEKNPPKVEAGMVAADWKKILEETKAEQSGRNDLADMTCDGWKELAAEYQSKASCVDSVRLYYTAVEEKK